MRAEEKILAVLNEINDQRRMTPAGKPVIVRAPKLQSDGVPFEEQSNILELLEVDRKVIKMSHKPNFEKFEQLTAPKPLTELDFDHETRVHQASKELYFEVVIKDGFNKLLEQFSANQITIETLTYANVLKVLNLADDIFQELNLDPSESVRVDASNSYNLFLATGKPSLSIADIKALRTKAAKFLKELGAVKDYYMDTNTFKLTVDRRIFFEQHKKLREHLAAFAPKPPVTPPKEQKTPENDSGKLKAQTPPQDTQIGLKFDDEHATVAYQARSTTLPYPSLEAHVLKEVLDQNGKRVTGLSLADGWNDEEGARSFYDAMIRVNKKLGEELGTHKPIRYHKEQYWLDEKYISREPRGSQ